jgi:hypothetical protein
MNSRKERFFTTFFSLSLYLLKKRADFLKYFSFFILFFISTDVNSQEIQKLKISGQLKTHYVELEPPSPPSNFGISAVKINIQESEVPLDVNVWSVDRREVVASGTTVNGYLNIVIDYESINDYFGYSYTNAYYIIYTPHDVSHESVSFRATITAFQNFLNLWNYMIEDGQIIYNTQFETALKYTNTSCDGRYLSFCTFETSVDRQYRYLDDTALMVFSNNRELVAFDLHRGVGNMSKINQESYSYFNNNKIVRYIGIGLNGWSEFSGKITLYASDLRYDNDGDGLSNNIEFLLGTCDNDQTHEYCTQVFNKVDSDRDGIEDNVEILGVEDNDSFHIEDNDILLFHHWGADPTHKDAFIELGFDKSSYTSNPFRDFSNVQLESWFDERQKPFLQGTAQEVDNISGLDGILLHIDIGDIGRELPESVSHKFGSWGGGGDLLEDVDERDFDEVEVAMNNMSPIRRKYFRYGIMKNGGGGQGPETAFHCSFDNASSFAHELGHTMGLNHFPILRYNEINVGYSNANCNPVYRSLMNYAFNGVGFSHGYLDGIPLDASSVNESYSVDGLINEDFFNGSSFRYMVCDGDAEQCPTLPNGSVDWSLDRVVMTSVRTPMNVGHQDSCGVYFDESRKHVFEIYDPEQDDKILSAPSFIVFNRNIYFVYTDKSGTVRYYFSKVLSVQNSSCFDGNNANSDNKCFDWKGPYSIDLNQTKFDSVSLEYKKEVLYISTREFETNKVHVFKLDVEENGLLLNPVDILPEVFISDVKPVLSKGIYGHQICLFASVSGSYLFSCLDAFDNWTEITEMRNSDGEVIQGNAAPGVKHWPDIDPLPIAYNSIETICGVFPNVDGKLVMYCLNSDQDAIMTNKWVLIDTFFNEDEYAIGDVNLSYNYYRDENGGHFPGYPGRFMVSFNSNENMEIGAPWTLAGRLLNPDNPPQMSQKLLSDTHTRDIWSLSGNNTAPVIYDHIELGGAKGGWLELKPDPQDESKNKYELQFYRTGDGVLDGPLKDTNDFHVMEAQLCRRLRNGIGFPSDTGNDFCGNFMQTRHGY